MKERKAKQQERLKAQRKRIEEYQRGRMKRIRGRGGWKTVRPQSLKQQKRTIELKEEGCPWCGWTYRPKKTLPEREKDRSTGEEVWVAAH